jgi:hypothetical protein
MESYSSLRCIQANGFLRFRQQNFLIHLNLFSDDVYAYLFVFLWVKCYFLDFWSERIEYFKKKTL